MEATPGLPTERLLTFEVAAHVYAVPIGDVAEVTDLADIAVVPTLPLRVGGVMNHHGDALPVVHRHILFETGEADLADPEHVLVLEPSGEERGGLGVPVDRILGLVDGSGGTARGEDAVVERRPMEGRVVSVLDTRRLVQRAVEAIEKSVLGADTGEGTET